MPVMQKTAKETIRDVNQDAVSCDSNICLTSIQQPDLPVFTEIDLIVHYNKEFTTKLWVPLVLLLGLFYPLGKILKRAKRMQRLLRLIGKNHIH